MLRVWGLCMGDCSRKTPKGWSPSAVPTLLRRRCGIICTLTCDIDHSRELTPTTIPRDVAVSTFRFFYYWIFSAKWETNTLLLAPRKHSDKAILPLGWTSTGNLLADKSWAYSGGLSIDEINWVTWKTFCTWRWYWTAQRDPSRCLAIHHVVWVARKNNQFQSHFLDIFRTWQEGHRRILRGRHTITTSKWESLLSYQSIYLPTSPKNLVQIDSEQSSHAPCTRLVCYDF